jgi:intracellular sulfur oxidation DsrE/DsrF family protein
MKTRITAFLLCLLFALVATAQSNDSKTGLSKIDIMRLAKFKAKGTYPLIKASPFSGVLPVDGITEMPDKTMKYKLVFSLITGFNDNGKDKAKELNRGLAEIGRTINLHIAAGIPKENLDVVIVAHSKAIYSLLTNEAYKKEFKTENPNIQIVQELMAAGARFIACGQTMQFLEVDKKELNPSVKIALSALVALSTYRLKGYTMYEIDEE